MAAGNLDSIVRVRQVLDRHTEPLRICTDPDCPGWRLSDSRHFDLHNRPCGHWFIATDGAQLLCELQEGHRPPCRGALRYSDTAATDTFDDAL